MVGSTAIFVNTLNPGTVPVGGTGSSVVGGGTSSSTTSTSSTTTTTIPADVAAYLVSVDQIEATGNELVERAIRINQEWDDKAIGFGTAVDQMEEFSRNTSQFAADVEAATPTIPRLEPAHLEVTVTARAMQEVSVDMLTGLQDPNSSQGRRDALASFLELGETLQNGIGVIRATAGGSGAGPSDTTLPTLPPIIDEPGEDE
jgi:hypothetical protein